MISIHFLFVAKRWNNNARQVPPNSRLTNAQSMPPKIFFTKYDQSILMKLFIFKVLDEYEICRQQLP